MNTSLMLRNPFSSVISTSALDQIFDDFLHDCNSVDALEKMLFSSSRYSVPYDVVSLQDDNGKEIGLEIRYALANYSKDEINVEVNGDTLTVSATKSEGNDSSKSGENVVRKCVYNGIKKSKFQMSYNLGRNVDKKKISPVFKDGTLTLTIPYYDKDVKDVRYNIEVK